MTQPLTQKTVELVDDGIIINHQGQTYKLELQPATPVTPAYTPAPARAPEGWDAFDELLDDTTSIWDD
jgi:hypothetical protein